MDLDKAIDLVVEYHRDDGHDGPAEEIIREVRSSFPDDDLRVVRPYETYQAFLTVLDANRHEINDAFGITSDDDAYDYDVDDVDDEEYDEPLDEPDHHATGRRGGRRRAITLALPAAVAVVAWFAGAYVVTGCSALLLVFVLLLGRRRRRRAATTTPTHTDRPRIATEGPS